VRDYIYAGVLIALAAIVLVTRPSDKIRTWLGGEGDAVLVVALVLVAMISVGIALKGATEVKAAWLVYLLSP
jgi:small neutral amino acid transporter SnatA (MarC family)